MLTLHAFVVKDKCDDWSDYLWRFFSLAFFSGMLYIYKYIYMYVCVYTGCTNRIIFAEQNWGNQQFLSCGWNLR